MANYHREFGFRRLINATGTLTINGAATVCDEALEAAGWAMARSFVVADLHRAASPVIAAATGAEAGCVTACSASGITLSVAAVMAGSEAARVAQLPDTTGLKNEIVLMRGHFVNFGAEIEQVVRLAGAKVVGAGQGTGAVRRGSTVAETSCSESELKAALGPKTAGALFVASHHAQLNSHVKLERFAAICHAAGVPVVVDAAAEADLTGFHEQGADLVIQSAHKFFAAPTSGVVSGRRDLVEAVLAHQIGGIGRPMKVGKEGIIGALAAIRRWAAMDHAAWRRTLEARLQIAADYFAKVPGIATEVFTDATGNPWPNLKVWIDAKTWPVAIPDLDRALYAGDPAVATRSMHSEGGYLYLDPRSLTDDEMRELCAILHARLKEFAGRAAAE